jgi:hypothetical protein
VYATVARHVRTDPEPDRGSALAGEVQRVCLSWIRAQRRCVDHDATYLLSAGRCYATGLMTDAATGVPVKVVRQLSHALPQPSWGVDTLDLELDLQGRTTRGYIVAHQGHRPPSRASRHRSAAKGRVARDRVGAGPVGGQSGGTRRAPGVDPIS